ncbi:MAG: ABC transporter permease [Acidobacteriaceae bacterium]|nr:ABC transporter permease [Acidobacteriaceae bacterium]
MSIFDRLWNALRPNRLNDEIRQELETHFALIEEEEEARGLTPDDARVRARQRFGNTGAYRDKTRDVDLASWLDSFRQDLRFASRQLGKSPGFAISAVLLLALGIGLNAAIFTIINSVILRSLPLPEPERLAIVEEQQGVFQTPPSWPDQLDLREANRVFQSTGGFSRGSNFIVRLGDGARSVNGSYVTPDYFATLGVQPIVGRVFDSSEAQAGRNSVALLREDFWHGALNSDPSVLQKTLVINGTSCNVIGILPSRFRFPSEETVVWMPLVPTAQEARRGWHNFPMVGRLKPGITIAQAQSDLESIMRRLRREYPETNRGRSALVIPFQSWNLDSGVRRRLFVLQIAALILFFMACANVSSLLLARYSSRRMEFALRAALGASRLRQTGQHVTESLLLTGFGCLAAVAVAWAGVRSLLWLYEDRMPRAPEIAPDWRLVGTVVLVAIAGALAIGLATAFHENTNELQTFIHEGGRASGGRRTALARRTLVVFQVACAVALLGGAGEILQSFWTLLHMDVGIDRAHLLTMRVELPSTNYKDGVQIGSFFDDAANRVRALPGVGAAAAINLLPVAEWGFNGNVNVEGLPAEHPGFFAEYRWVTHDYFRTMHIPLVRGRLFSPEEISGSRSAAIINEAMARALWGEKNPLGAHINFFSPAWITVVGICRDVRQSGVEVPPSPELFLPARSYSAPFSSWSIVVRSSLSAESLVPGIRRAISRNEQDAVISHVRTMDDVVSDSVSYQRIVAALLMCFAILALTLAALGVYGIVSYVVAARTPELAIRTALGSTPSALVALVARQGMGLVAAGLAIGFAAMIPVSSLLADFLYGVHGINVPVFGVVLGILFMASGIAVLVPAMRSARIDPIRALRQE